MEWRKAAISEAVEKSSADHRHLTFCRNLPEGELPDVLVVSMVCRLERHADSIGLRLSVSAMARSHEGFTDCRVKLGALRECRLELAREESEEHEQTAGLPTRRGVRFVTLVGQLQDERLFSGADERLFDSLKLIVPGKTVLAEFNWETQREKLATALARVRGFKQGGLSSIPILSKLAED